MKRKREIINWLLLIIWMGFIFYMSNQPANVSDGQSNKVLFILTGLGLDVNGIFGELANFVVRKCAHFLEYMILAFLLLNVVNIYCKSKVSSILSVVFVFLYACTDEFHQIFVHGREGAFRDVIIDTCGGITLILLYNLIRGLKNRYIRKEMQ